MEIVAIQGGFQVPLSCGRWKARVALGHALIDEDMVDIVNRFKWSLSDTGYAYKTFRENGRIRHQKMHRMIMNAPDEMQVDHINGNRLDNRKANLRLCSLSENRRNSFKRSCVCTSKFKGVYFDKFRNKWAARIRCDDVVTFIGRYDSEIEAALAFNVCASFLHKEFAKLNRVSF